MLKNKCLLNIFIKYIDTDIMKNIVKEDDFLVIFPTHPLPQRGINFST